MSTLNLSLVGLGLRVAVTLVVLVNTLLIARVLGPAAFGEYFLFFRLISVLGAFADFGLAQSVNAFYGRHEESRASIHRIVLRLVPILWLVVTIIGGFIVWLGGDLLLPHLMPLLTFAAFAVLPLSMYANLWNGMMLGAGRIWRVNVVQFVMCSLSLVLTVVVVVTLRGGVVGAAVCYTAVMAVQAVVMVALESRSTAKQALSERPSKSEPHPEISRKMIHFGLRGYLGSISALLWTRMPVFILNVMQGPTAVGIFSLSQQVVEKLLFPVQSVRDAVYQKMSVLPSQSAYPAFERYVRLMAWGMFVLVIAAGLVTPLIISLLLGPQYTEAIQLVRILLLGAVFAAVSLLLDAFFVNQLHRPGLVSVLSWFRLVVGLTLVAVLIPRHGAKGVAAAIVLTQIVTTLVYLTIYVKITRTRVARLLFIDGDDLELLKRQVYMLFKPRRDGTSEVGSAE